MEPLLHSKLVLKQTDDREWIETVATIEPTDNEMWMRASGYAGFFVKPFFTTDMPADDVRIV